MSLRSLALFVFTAPIFTAAQPSQGNGAARFDGDWQDADEFASALQGALVG